MKSRSNLRAALIVLTSLIVTSCGSLDKQLHEASVEKGKVQARVNLPPLPPDCRAHESHAPDPVGAEAIIVLKAERRATKRANDRTDRCAKNYDTVAAELEGQAQ